MKPLAHFICHAHLDPVWLWEWEEGLGAALATFRAAADICETHEGFIFNQNEALLYEWVEQYEPKLFERIRKLVADGRWHIMGGWYLQPDCNLPSGESICRQIERGLEFFESRFGQRPTTAINFDSFGHSRGLVQILRHYAFDSYLICRPDNNFCPLPSNDFIWEGFDGGDILVRRIPQLYNSQLGEAEKYIRERLESSPESKMLEAVLWGVGNHGGGPSRKDLEDLRNTGGEIEGYAWSHSRPEDYFRDLAEDRENLPIVREDLNRWAVGCYTSQIRIKQGHRALENELFRAEKMLSLASAKGLLSYPRGALAEAERDLLICQFHDILPGSSVQSAEEASLRLIGHGREILARETSRAFFALQSGQPAAAEGDFPVLVFNPHPHRFRTEIDVEFQMEKHNWSDQHFDVEVRDAEGNLVESQIEREACNMPLDWRKRVVFVAELGPQQMHRFNLTLHRRPFGEDKAALEGDTSILVETAELSLEFCKKTGRLKILGSGGEDFLDPAGIVLELVKDVPDAWIGTHTKIGPLDKAFQALDSEEAGRFAGVDGPAEDGLLSAVRIVEAGPVRTVVEVLCGAGENHAQILYSIPMKGRRVGVSIRLYNNEKDRATKLRIPVVGGSQDFIGDTMFGCQELPVDGTECAFQRWCMVKGEGGKSILVVNDGTCGIPGYRARIRPIVSRITIHWPSFYNVVTGKTLALPNLIALQHIPLSPAGVIAKRPAPIALPNSCAAEWRMAPDAVFSPYASVRYFTPHMVHSQYNLL